MGYEKALLMLTVLVLAWIIEPVWAVGLGSPGPCQARNAAEIYCLQHGGCARDGYCYFSDGTYCGVWSFYNGTCPGRTYYEQLLWEQEAYRFLYSDYYPVYQPYVYYYYQPPYWPGYGYYWSDYLSPYPPGPYGGV